MKAIQQRAKVAQKAAIDAGRMLLNNFEKKIKVSTKKDGSLVTQFDIKAEKIIINSIKKYFPDDNILSEECGHDLLTSEFTWIIDPIDGTHNYIRGITSFGTSIAVKYKEEIIIGVIYMPVEKELYTAKKGKGAFKNGKKIRVSDKPLEESTMIYDSTIKLNQNEMLKGLNKLADKVFNIRMFGSTVRSLTYVAEGKAEMEIEFNDKIWDFAAGALLVKEAGGVFTDFIGKEEPWQKEQAYIASNKTTYKHLLNILKNIL
ncbi:hypothetical protein A3J90_03075 [candidate division WOR-1 bacterium RIFOXYC2_FULL_37_10]|uniref:Inositol-1-monophosphatase n=1 Tax=candidate division WOR-1 bacterium RIFOXYB2_FULL_37_13 TaxID=1802579 RepID=A0A1F4SFV3_UNCSA|nr:MAG: hypothetical protein A2246_06450 [candidate division WOR-1 bacterium RIFOXYA2_FULL_37_7]OGC18603.1 MAG: hypothetical protein A2310_03445 [candidate division WOR-1 bacterium RIFOXYB2_FULL_37_13]OGC36817.1 MAG: hypothetical protein A3J90_03075 [candidate division WOR-1 bacterium RIFOXYC2_FULL_37_10]